MLWSVVADTRVPPMFTVSSTAFGVSTPVRPTVTAMSSRRVRAMRASPGQTPRPEVSHAWDMLQRSRGAVSVADLAAETGWSARHLGEQFRAETGLSPKAGARVVRFDRARRRLLRQQAERGRVVLAELAAECGYYDQAHLAREFRDLAGCPPSALLAEELRNVQAVLEGNWE